MLVDRFHPGMDADFISIDNAGAVRTALNHLREQGWRHLLMISEPVTGVSSRTARKQAFHEWIRQQADTPDACTGSYLKFLNLTTMHSTRWSICRPGCRPRKKRVSTQPSSAATPWPRSTPWGWYSA